MRPAGLHPLLRGIAEAEIGGRLVEAGGRTLLADLAAEHIVGGIVAAPTKAVQTVVTAPDDLA